MPYLIIWIRVFLGAHALLSGLNHFFEFFPLPPVDLSPAGAFVSAMTEVGLYDVIKVVEVVVGFCLVFNFFVPLALILEFPITLSIFWLNVFIDGEPRQLFTGIREMAFHLILFTAYAGYYLDMLRVKAPQQTLWSKQIWSEIPERLNR
jgi:hypothetical protein